MAPTCQSLGDALADHMVSDGIRFAESQAGGTAWLAGRWADRKIKASPKPTVPRRYD